MSRAETVLIDVVVGYAPLLWLAAAMGVLLVTAGLAGIGWHHLTGRETTPADGPECCLACEAAGDDLEDVADDAFDGTPVNEPHPNRWGAVDVSSPNDGAWLDVQSRLSNGANARWITGMQQRKLGEVLAREAEQWLQDQARRPGETTGEIRLGDPGE